MLDGLDTLAADPQFWSFSGSPEDIRDQQDAELTKIYGKKWGEMVLDERHQVLNYLADNYAPQDGRPPPRMDVVGKVKKGGKSVLE